MSPLITADDWGISPGVNEGILDLARRGVVRRVSLLADGAFLGHGLADLLAARDLGLGLHLNLTHGAPPPGAPALPALCAGGRYPSARALAGRWLLRALRPALEDDVRRAFDAQLARLARAGVTPTHLDGHQHVHLLPGLMTALAPRLAATAITHVRLPDDPRLLLSPRAPVYLLARARRGEFRALGLRSLPCVYPLARDLASPARLRRLLAAHPGAEVIVHPARAADLAAHGVPDPYDAPRVREYETLLAL